MAESTDRENLPQATVVPKRRTRISVVWIIPILAAAVAIGIAVQRVLSEGPTITIIFKSAEGLEAGKTFVKYKDVNIGQVSAVHLSPDYSKVEVTAKIAKSAAGLMVEGSKFWVVEPRITLSGVSGLGTVLSGNYIGIEVGKSNKKQRKFTGLEVPPIIIGGQPGRQFVLKADKLGSLGIGAPVYYRSLQAGQVIAYDLAADGKAVDVKIFVNAPYERYVHPGTRFWNASGFDVSVGAGGVEVRTESLVALIAGGVAFDTPPFDARTDPAAANTGFTLHGDRATAMKKPEAIASRYVLYFTESLRGLSVGAPVTLLGLPGGEVTAVGLDLDPATLSLRGRVEIVTFAHRLTARLTEKQAAVGQAFASSVQERHAYFQHMVEQRGLRAQLQSGSLLTGQLYVAFDYHPDAPKAKVDWSQDVPVLPVVAGTLPDVEAKLASIVAKLDKLPYEAIGADLAKALVTLNETLQGANKAIATADGVLKNTDATLLGPNAPAQQELRDVLQEVARAARSIRVLTDYLERHPEALIRGKTEEKP